MFNSGKTPFKANCLFSSKDLVEGNYLRLGKGRTIQLQESPDSVTKEVAQTVFASGEGGGVKASSLPLHISITDPKGVESVKTVYVSRAHFMEHWSGLGSIEEKGYCLEDLNEYEIAFLLKYPATTEVLPFSLFKVLFINPLTKEEEALFKHSTLK